MTSNTVSINRRENSSKSGIALTVNKTEKSPRKRCSSKKKKTDGELVHIFWSAPPEAYFSDETIAPVTGCTRKTLQCNRWKKSGIPFRKVSGRVLYRKIDVVSYLESHQLMSSTSEYRKEVEK